jgi:hypothetical protein
MTNLLKNLKTFQAQSRSRDRNPLGKKKLMNPKELNLFV